MKPLRQESPDSSALSDNRTGLSRRSMLAGGGAAVAATALGTVAFAEAAGASLQHVSPMPKPIPGEIPADPADPDGLQIHWFLPGPTDAVSPIIGLPGFGLDVEPSSITDFKGTTAFAIINGEATTNDGETQGVEFDIRVMDGTYISESGTEQHASFAFIWVDLFDLGSGSQTHDFTPGISPNRLFWVTEIPRGSFGSNGKRAGLRLRNFPLIDSYTFLGPNSVSSTVDMDLVWSVIGPYEDRGKGKEVEPTDPAAFLGRFAEARCYGYVSGKELWFSFKTNKLESGGFYAQLGEERNGSYL